MSRHAYDTCALCGQEILDITRSGIARQVVGWQIPRSGGGIHALSGRYETGAIAHVSCAKGMRPKDQAQLWESRQEQLWSST